MTPFEVGKAWGGNRKGDQAEAGKQGKLFLTCSIKATF